MDHHEEDEYGWGIGSVIIFLVVVLCLIFLPFGMGPAPIGPPAFSTLLLFPVFLAAIFMFLYLSS
ncbi:uncharacterized protein LOC124918794 [Impatiens glandulifera]|uniref:uncharacterized protein LOC124918794 n=1 Tax=Impatiens glandulifera TaxID=253017 RepID=UPI001FB08B1C|nr:uncharacterized protein LOC124918794 [Impatiens glandulifera]